MKSFKSFRSTKIVSTLGPASEGIRVIKSLMISGVNVFRLNFSHGSHEDHQNRIKIIRNIEKEKDHSIAIIADLQGPKYRIGKIHKSLFIEKGNLVNFHLTKPTEKFSYNSIQNEFHIPLPHSEIFLNVMPDENLLVNDGKLEFKIKSVTDDKIIAEGSQELLVVKYKNSYTSKFLHDVLRMEDKIKRKTLQK